MFALTLPNVSRLDRRSRQDNHIPQYKGTHPPTHLPAVPHEFRDMTYAPVVFLSALTGSRVDRIFQAIQDVHAQNTSRITTGALNSVLADATARVQPPTDKGRRLKIYYMTQASTKPPHFVIFCNDARLFHFSLSPFCRMVIRMGVP